MHSGLLYISVALTSSLDVLILLHPFSHSPIQKRRHSLAGTRANQPKEEGGKSLFKLLMNKPWKRRSVSTPAIDKEVESRCRDTNEGAGSRVKVVVSVLQPGLYYKSVPVTTGTTVNDVIVELVSKYAVLEEDMDPTAFYLMEVCMGGGGGGVRV